MDNAPTILIVEDQPRHLRLIRDSLEDEGYGTIEATNVAEALTQIQEKRGKSQYPRAILIDVGIPESSGAKISKDGGLKLLRQLREKEKINIPAILVTIWSAEPNVKETAEKYGIPIVSKPLDIERLLRETRKAVGR